MAFGSISDLWNKWNIRGFVILSLSLQVFLILCAPLRKKIANPHIVVILWLAYLMADLVATSGIGLICHGQGNLSTRATEVDGSLQAFWVSFLLLHLGGPDTITAFSLEDSSLWRRHLLSLIFQVSFATYVFVQIFPSDKSLIIPTMLIFLSGVIKNVERILALNLSSLPRLKQSMHTYDNIRDDACSKLDGELQVLGHGYSDEEEAKIAESIVVKHAYYFFQIFKVFLIDLFYNSNERLISRKYFHKVSAMDALRVISVELHFIYEVLYTKALTIRSKWSYIFRFIAFIDVAMAFVLFNHFKKHQLPKLDVEITYILLFGGIALDVITLFTFVFSDWTVARIMNGKIGSSKLYLFLDKLISAMDDLRKPRLTTCEPQPNYAVLDTPFIIRRWSESIFACDFFFAIWKESPRKINKPIRHQGVIVSYIRSLTFHMAKKIITYLCQAYNTAIGRESSILPLIPTSKNPFIKKLWIFIFKEMRHKSKGAVKPKKAREIFEARGDMFLQSKLGEIDCHFLLKHVTEAPYDSSVIMWHIATEIWYNREELTEKSDERKFSKILSDYLLYLFVNQLNLVSIVAGMAQVTLSSIVPDLYECTVDANDMNELYKTFYEGQNITYWNNLRDPLDLGILLAREMEGLGDKKWEVMSGVWVEMLTYAAGHIKGEEHVKMLSKGGELLAFVWLLMAHFGCICKPEWSTYEEFMFGNGNEEEDDKSTVATQVEYAP